MCRLVIGLVCFSRCLVKWPDGQTWASLAEFADQHRCGKESRYEHYHFHYGPAVHCGGLRQLFPIEGRHAFANCSEKAAEQNGPCRLPKTAVVGTGQMEVEDSFDPNPYTWSGGTPTRVLMFRIN